MTEIEADVTRKVVNAEDGRFTRGCQGKIRYQTHEEAKRSAKVMHKKHHKAFDAYGCRFCSAFHVGTRRSEAARQKRRMAAA